MKEPFDKGHLLSENTRLKGEVAVLEYKIKQHESISMACQLLLQSMEVLLQSMEEAGIKAVSVTNNEVE